MPDFNQPPSLSSQRKRPAEAPKQTDPLAGKKKQDNYKSLTQRAAYAHQADDTATTHSQMTNTIGTSHAKFTEMEMEIRKNNQAIQEHKDGLKDVNARVLTTLDLCKAASTNILERRQETSTNINTLRIEAAANFARPNDGTHSRSTSHYHRTKYSQPGTFSYSRSSYARRDGSTEFANNLSSTYHSPSDLSQQSG